MGRPRRGRAVLARGDGAQVPPPRLVGRARRAADRLRRGPLRRRQHRDQQRPLAPPPDELADGVAAALRHRRVRRRHPRPLRRRWSRAGSRSAARPAAPPLSSALLERGATKLGWRSVEFPRVFRYDDGGRGREADDGPHADPAGGRRRRRRSCPTAGVVAAGRRAGDRVVGAEARRARPDGGPDERLTIRRRARRRVRRRHPDAGAAAAQRLPAARSGAGSSCTRRSRSPPASRTRSTTATCPMHRITEFAPNLTIGGSASRRGPRRPRPRRLRRRPAPAARGLGARVGVLRRHPQRGRRPRASRCPGCATRS